MIVGLVLFVLGLLATVVPGRHARVAGFLSAVSLVAAAVLDVVGGIPMSGLGTVLQRTPALDLAGPSSTSRALLLGGLGVVRPCR